MLELLYNKVETACAGIVSDESKISRNTVQFIILRCLVRKEFKAFSLV